MTLRHTSIRVIRFGRETTYVVELPDVTSGIEGGTQEYTFLVLRDVLAAVTHYGLTYTIIGDLLPPTNPEDEA